MAKVFNGRLSIGMELEILLLEKRCRVGRTPRRVFCIKQIFSHRFFKIYLKTNGILEKRVFLYFGAGENQSLAAFLTLL